MAAGITAANRTLAERRRFPMDQDKWEEFHDILDHPVRQKPRLHKLLIQPGVLD